MMFPLFFLSTTLLVSPGLAYCPSITQTGGSELNPQRTEGGNVTMFKTFVTDGNVGLLNVTWTRTPSPLSYSQGRFRTQNKTSGTGQLTASLKVWDLKFYPDLGDYTVSVCNNCTCKNTTFFLHLFDCDPSTAVPQPVKEYQYHVWAESGLPSDLELYVFFNGSADTFIYSMRWSHKGGDACSIQNNSCDRTFYESCAFTANLHIPNPSHKSSGLYTVQAIGSGEGRVASYNLYVLQQPYISCSRHHITVGSVECTLRNYSEFTDLSVVRDNVTLVEMYPAESACEPHAADGTLAKCRVKLKEGSFSICVDYNSSVEGRPPMKQCSSTVHVSPEESTWITVVPALIFLVVVLVIIIVAAIVLCRKRRGQNEGEHTRLLTNGNGSSTTGRQSYTGQPGASADVETDGVASPEVPVAVAPLATGPGSDTERDFPRQPRLPVQESSEVDNVHGPGQLGAASTINHPPQPPAERVTFFYPQNPGRYEQIESLDESLLTPDELQQYREEIMQIEQSREEAISRNRNLVKAFALFIQCLGVTVAYDQQIDAIYYQSKPGWLVERVEESDYAIFIITPSFLELLDNAPDHEEICFQKNLISSLINGVVWKKTDGTKVKVICVFLNHPVHLDYVPPSLRTGNVYMLWTDPQSNTFNSNGEGPNGSKAFSSLLTGGAN